MSSFTEQLQKMKTHPGFIAALDQSGGTSPSFTGERILGAILFENTMDREIEGQPSADYLWNVKRVVPFLKVDKGLAARGRSST